MAEAATRVENSGTNKRFLSFVLDMGRKYQTLRKTMTEGIMKKKTFTQEELEEAREAWIRG